MAQQMIEQVPAPENSRGLWAGVIGAPLAWGVQMQVSYALAPWACRSRLTLVIHLVTLVCVLAALWAAHLSWHEYKLVGGSPEETDGGPVARTRFLGMLGFCVAITSALLIVAQGLSSFFFDPCWTGS